MDEVAVAWSTGKDAAVALREVAADPDIEVVELLTTVSAATGRVRGHGVPSDVLERQADALGYPLRTVELPDDDGGYERALRAALDTYEHRGIDRVVYGDLFVESVREYRESLLAEFDVEGHWPLWGRESRDVVEAFHDAGFEATVVRVDGDRLDPPAVCRDFDAAFRADLPEGADPCGEDGAFHTFVRDGPLFGAPVPVRAADRTTLTVAEGPHSGTYHYCDLELVESPTRHSGGE